MKLKTKIKYLTLSISISFAGVVVAQSEQSTDSVAESEKAKYEKIVITARKRSEELIDIADQVSVFGEQDIERAGIEGIKDISQLLPNMSLVDTQNPGTVFINLRGVGQYRNSEPPVAIIVDGVQLVSTDAITQDLYDIQQIEVLKGPQGALFGRNAVGGAINITTKAPTDTWEGNVKVGYANGNEINSSVVISGPLIEDKVYARFSTSARESDGVIKNIALGKNADPLSDRNSRLRITADLTDSLFVDFRASYSDLKAGSSYFAATLDDEGFALDDAAQQRFDVQTSTDGKSERELSEIALKLDYEWDDYTLTSISGYTKTKENFFQDLDFTLAPVLDFGQLREVEAFSQELRLSYDSGDDFNGIVGIYLLDSEREINTNVFGSLANIGTANDPEFINGNISIYDFVLDAPVDTHFVNLANLEDNFAWAIFANSNYSVNDKVNLSVGVRYDEDHRKQIDLNSNEVIERTFSLVQPKIQASYKQSDSSNYYISWGKGFRSGGFNQEDTVSDSYEAEEVTSAEIGFKTLWNDDAISFNGALFHTDFNNRQDFTFIAGVQTILTIPDAQIIGAELEIKAEISDSLKLFLSGGVLNTEIQSEVVGFNPIDAGLPADNSFIGNNIPLAYGWSYAIGTEYQKEASWGWFTARIDYSAKGDMDWELANQDHQENLHLVNARFLFENDDLSLTFWAKNLFDKQYYQEFVSREFSALPTDIGFPSAGRRYGVTFTSRF